MRSDAEMAIIEGQKIKVTWTGNTKKHYEMKGYVFTKHNDEFVVDVKDLTLGSSSVVQCICDKCDKRFNKRFSYISKQDNHYCSLKCSSEAKKKNKINKKCEICNSPFKVIPSMSNQKFCSIECQGKWQTLTRIGNNSSNYNQSISIDDRNLNCEWCNKIFSVVPSKIKTARFCSIECRRDWFAKEWSQQEAWKEESRKRAVKILDEGKISKTESEAQKTINKTLEQMKIKYENEYNCTVVSIDNYLPEYKLMIEVMGGYWHVDPRLYSSIKYQMQYDRVINDKRKRGIIKRYYDINILYLWEKDIKENINLCKRLIDLYIKSSGVLSEYNSFNYSFDNNDLFLNKKYIPFMEMSSSELNDIFIPVDGKKKSYKQHDKWITFNCECCGEETEQLKSRYIKNKKHHCSTLCKKMSQQINNSSSLGVQVNCSNCNKEKTVTNYMYQELLNGKRQNFFCDYNCYNDWQKINMKGNKNPNYKKVSKIQY